MKTARILFAAMIVFAMVAGTLSLYTAGYFWLGKRSDTLSLAGRPGPYHIETIDRIYPEKWQSLLFEPAGTVEARLRGVNVYVVWRGEYQHTMIE
jgi:hypothetical protein